MTKITNNIKQINSLLNASIPATVAQNGLKAISAVAGAVAYSAKNSIIANDLAFFSNLLSADLDFFELHAWNAGEDALGIRSQQNNGYLSIDNAVTIANNLNKSVNNIAIVVSSGELSSFLTLLKLVYNVFKLPQLNFLIKRVENLITLETSKMNGKNSVNNVVNSVNKSLRDFAPFSDFYKTTENIRNLATFEDAEPTTELAEFIARRNAKLTSLQQHFTNLSIALNTGQITAIKLANSSNNSLPKQVNLANSYTYLACFSGSIEVITFLTEFFSNETGQQ